MKLEEPERISCRIFDRKLKKDLLNARKTGRSYQWILTEALTEFFQRNYLGRKKK